MVELSSNQLDACSGIALLYIGPRPNADVLVEKVVSIMTRGDAETAARVTAILLLRLVDVVPMDSLTVAAERWDEAFDGRRNDVSALWLARIKQGKRDLDIDQLSFWAALQREAALRQCPYCGGDRDDEETSNG